MNSTHVTDFRSASPEEDRSLPIEYLSRPIARNSTVQRKTGQPLQS